MKLGDMHHAIVALEELDGIATAEEVALKLRWIGRDHRPDKERARTALIAAYEHRYVEVCR